MMWDNEKKPDVWSGKNVLGALAIHASLFLFLYGFAVLHTRPSEVVVPIDLTVVVNENLDGKEDEPPPVDDPPPPEPEPPKTPPPEPPPAPPVPEDAVVKVPDKEPPKPPKEEKKPEKKPEQKPDKPPKPTLEDRIKAMRDSATVVNKPVKIKVPKAPTGDGKTERQTRTPEEIARLLNQGYRPGSKTQLATSAMQRCISLVQRALNDKWNQMQPEVGAEGTVYLSVRFDGAGRMVDPRIERSCGDRISDRAALSVASAVGYVGGLDADFISQFGKERLTIKYDVRRR